MYNSKKVRNIVDFIETIKVVNIIGRNAHNTRHNLFYDSQANIVYNTGHAVVISKKLSNYSIKTQCKINANMKQKSSNSPSKDKALCLDHKNNSWHF